MGEEIEENLEPIDVCPITVSLLLQLGTLNEIVRRQPGNRSARAKQLKAKKILDEHLESCEKCKKNVKFA